jgi:hypothetical protein
MTYSPEVPLSLMELNHKATHLSTGPARIAAWAEKKPVYRGGPRHRLKDDVRGSDR